MDNRYRKFLALSEAGSFSAAARQLHVTQPAISLAVVSLEHALGVRLYVRRSRPLALTSEGRIVAGAARNMAAEHERMLAALRAGAPAKRVPVGLIDSIAHLLYASDSNRPLLAGLEVMVDNSQRILRDLAEGRIELGVVTGQPAAPGRGLTAHKLHSEAFVFVAAPSHAPAHAAGRIDDWLATNPDSTTYKHFLALFERRHLQVTPVFHSASMELLRDMARAGRGTALLPRHFVRADIENGSLVAVRAKPLYRPVWVVTRHPGAVPTAFTVRLNELLAQSG